MAHEVETMFSTRVTPWHGLGNVVSEAPDSKTALQVAGLDWNVLQKDVYTQEGFYIPGYKLAVWHFSHLRHFSHFRFRSKSSVQIWTERV